jgi:hypothetical protein
VDEQRIREIPSYTRKVVFGCGNLYVTINELDGSPIRVFLELGKAGMCQGALLEGVARLVTIMIQDLNAPIERICHTLSGIRCDKGCVGNVSCMDALARELKAFADTEEKNGCVVPVQ